jgi:hypothetical protein
LFLEDFEFPYIFLVRQGFGCNLAVSSPFLYSLVYSMSFPPNIYRILLNCILKLALKRIADEGREKSETKKKRMLFLVKIKVATQRNQSFA